MNTNQYKTGVLKLIARIKNYNPEIGQYISHSFAEDKEFIIQLTNGTVKLPPEVAHSQEVFPALVPEAWVIEIEKSFAKSLVQVSIPEARSRWKMMFAFLTY